MQKTQVIPHFLVPADQHAPEAVHPTMRAFDDPPAGFEPGLLLERLSLLPPRTDMGGEPKLGQQRPHLIIVIAFGQTHPLRGVRRGVRPLHGDTLNGGSCHLEIIAIRPVHGQADGHARAVGKDTALGAAFAAIGRVLAHLFPPQGGLWSWPRPSPATPSQCPARRHSPPGLVPIRPRRCPPPSTLGSGGGQHYGSRAPWRPGHPTGTRCGGRRRWHPWLGDHRRGGDDTPKDAVCAVGARARCAPITHLEYASPCRLARARQASVRLLEERSFCPQDTMT